MGDRISSLPDDVVCYILSFLPTKAMVATSVLSKRWKTLWRSVATLSFGFDDHYLYSDESNFIHSVNAFLFSPHRHQCLQNLRLCRFMKLYHQPTPDFYQSFVTLFLAAASVQHRFEHLVLILPFVKIPSVLLTCKTLVVFKLCGIKFDTFYSVDLPSLKILSLECVTFQEYGHLADLLSACPKLQDMKVIDLWIRNKSYVIQPKFTNLSKLISLSMDKDIIPLQVVYNVQFLCIEWTDMDEITPDLTLEFHNLTHIEFRILGFTNHWLNVFKVLKHCPKLQNLVIHKLGPPDNDEWKDWQFPLCVPNCISSHLKTCRINFYGGRESDFEFARYIMQNVRQLHNMTICFHFEITEGGRCEMTKTLCICRRFSSICKLTFCCLDENDIWIVSCIL